MLICFLVSEGQYFTKYSLKGTWLSCIPAVLPLPLSSLSTNVGLVVLLCLEGILFLLQLPL